MFAELDLTVTPYSQQREWRHLILLAFFFGGLGTGTYLLGAYLGLTSVMITGFLITMVGKGGCHLTFLGHPERFWRMMNRPHASWVSRGFWGVLIYGLTSPWVIMDKLGWLSLGGGLYWTLATIAALAAFWVMIYTGFVVSVSRAIPTWNTTVVPLIFTLYGIVGGLHIVLITLGLSPALIDTMPVTLSTLWAWDLGLLLVALFLVLVYVMVLNVTSHTTQEAVRRMLKGELFGLFVIGVVVVGMLIPGALTALSLFGVMHAAGWEMVVSGFMALIGSLSFRWVLLRVGLYSPLM